MNKLESLKPLKPGKFIYMPKADLERWLEVLRAPENQKRQGTGALFSPNVSERGYCCLGVGQWSKEGAVAKDEDFPALDWLDAKGWRFLNEKGERSNNPWLLIGTASNLNDERKFSFKEIAALIEAAAEGY